ncbi:Arf GTPase activating protein [Basidiobolus meristosporus CBS 931.73]|uniref:Arf GTPase activating protein n=1 Tax=Basidiobolus meristosporus CBS 931.73 TaxID=1314790 RepID=A0A1Y1XWQ1_9FUNG|nr:Arf GTPase activating protein [Basidiobolus meristosporus CBS 931.73]|eukprot:ORX90162.1 Arf GTPase activating protein [Basidiobolus meristosporus CBS 931.73]
MSKWSLSSLFQIPENNVCADCGKKDPRWASHNLGVFICIGCSGIHRSLGTHISKVKSVDLDKWTEDQLENMMRWGNARANKYWQAKLPADFQPPESYQYQSYVAIRTCPSSIIRIQSSLQIS